MEIRVIQKKIDEQKKQIAAGKKRSSAYAMQRGALILLALFSLFRGYYYEQLFYIVCLLSFSLFLYVAARHRALKQQLEDDEVMAEVLKDIIQRKKSGWKSFADTGSEFL